MASLSKNLISQFAKLVKPETSKNETTAYGTIVEQDGVKYVRLDGSTLLTPISTTVDMLDGERVTAMIKNHSVVVTGNISSPAARSGKVNELAVETTDLGRRTTTLEGNISAEAMVNLIYPVGSIYISVSDISPETLFGCKWEQIEDRFLLAAGTSYEAGSTGGEAEHTLTVDEMPSHTHASQGNAAVNNSGSYTALITNGSDTSKTTLSTGGSQPHNNMPPYLAVYIWKRIE